MIYNMKNRNQTVTEPRRTYDYSYILDIVIIDIV